MVVCGRPLEHFSSALISADGPLGRLSKAACRRNDGGPSDGKPEELPHPHAEGAICFAEYFSTGGGTRTLTGSLLLDFESSANAIKVLGAPAEAGAPNTKAVLAPRVADDVLANGI